MKTYRLLLTVEANFQWFGTLAEVKAAIKPHTTMRDRIMIDEVEVPTHKPAIIAMLNGSSDDAWPVSKEFQVTPRGAIVEVKE